MLIFETDDQCIWAQENDDQSLTLGVKRRSQTRTSRGTLTFIEGAQVCGTCTYIHRAIIAQAETHILGPEERRSAFHARGEEESGSADEDINWNVNVYNEGSGTCRLCLTNYGK